MGHRHFPNSFRLLTDQGHNGNPSTADQSYIHMGRTPVLQSSALTPPLENTMIGGIHTPPQWNPANRINEYSASSFGMEIPHFSQPFPGASYDPLLHSSASGNVYLVTQNNVVHAHPDYCHTWNVHENENGPPGSATNGGRGPYKRKNPGISEAHERGSTGRFYSAGSSSSSSGLPLLPEKPTPDYHNIPSGNIGIPHYGCGNLSIAGEDLLRNVRSRPRLDLEANTAQTHSSNYSSYHYNSTAYSSRHPGAAELTSVNGDETTQQRNFNTLPPASHGRILTSVTNGLNYESNQFLVRDSGLQAGFCHPNSVQNQNLVSSSQYLHASPIWGAREGHGNHAQRSMPSYRTGSSYQQFRHEAVSAENSLQPISETYYSRYSRLSSRGWRNSHGNRRSRTTMERFQSLPGVVDAEYRIGSEDFVTMDHSSLYATSGNLFDQYRDMRLDVDNMSYEELLALGERIGNVSTGLSEEMISKCLMERNNSDLNHEDGRCCICLEEYADGDEVGSMKKCGHDYHVSCIRKWLEVKNTCPICKATALTDCLEE